MNNSSSLSIESPARAGSQTTESLRQLTDPRDMGDESLRILFLADPMIPVPPKLYGGIERIIDMLCHDMAARGHQIGLVSHADSTVDCSRFSLPRSPSGSIGEKLGSVASIIGAVRSFRPDVIHSFARLAYLWPLLRMSAPKLMSYQREPTLSRIKNTARLAKRGTLLFTGCSDYITHQIRQVAAAETVYNGVPLDRYELRETVSADSPLVFLGRVERIKGVHNAIEIAKATGRRLTIAGNVPGDAESQAYFENQVKPHLNDRIQYIGPVDDQQKDELLGSAAAMVMAIEWDEPYGIVMAEALACGTPILGTPRGAVPEVIQHGITGFISDSIPELIKAVDKLPELSRRACRQACEARFSSGVIVDCYLALYRQMLARTR